jgi:hypothetical protein
MVAVWPCASAALPRTIASMNTNPISRMRCAAHVLPYPRQDSAHANGWSSRTRAAVGIQAGEQAFDDAFEPQHTPLARQALVPPLARNPGHYVTPARDLRRGLTQAYSRSAQACALTGGVLACLIPHKGCTQWLQSPPMSAAFQRN